ncbi:N-acetylglucosamine-specific PTS transporter subunit IIBC [Pseudalkalibacillus salsuginis]|uniref:N-acetylglucosamine-specific PTS transporter subunit IIBC n=1 Tax=Pseudalkalibacillus salsuginis TaxID=2910972 RepID=UPI001F1AD2F3|nr:N-acetylglucosamine-specific PTS transporter subunit IIBC [Pseudalkalibacillus salsuginis]MCF6410320.1 N-acetylglucosamine-specific PTS transporter subunit IIBC [Pseudalkalibacillus salsuginis]
MLGFLQRIGRALMLPIAIMPAAALLLRLGQDDLLGIPFIAAAGAAIFDHLPLLFAIGVAIGLAKDSNGAAGLAGAVGFFILTQGTQAINEDINMAFLGGILSGVVAGLLYNRFYDIELPDYLGFFGGRRFVPIVTAGAMVLLAAIFGFVWPPIQDGINAVGQWIIDAGAAGVGIYGFMNRLLIPIGLHHVLNSLVWFVFGEYNGATGDLHRFFAGDPEAGIFMAGFFPIMMFGLPAACFAMIAAAKKEKKKAVTGMLIGLAFTSFLTGITEPIEFSFMFLSPILYGVHAFLTGSAMVVAYVLDIHHGFGFSAGAIDFFLNLGIAKGEWLLFGVGLVYAVIYFVVFYFLIKALDLKTPGREDDTEEEDEELETGTLTGNKHDVMAHHFLQALGGGQNIQALDSCATRLRLKVADMDSVDEKGLKKHGARGVMKIDRNNLQVIVGTNVEFVATSMQRQMAGGAYDEAASPSRGEKYPNEKTGVGDDDFTIPIDGNIIPITEVDDPAFSEKMMGDGFAIEPTGNMIISPVDGKVVNIFPTKHAIGIESKQGYEILIHIGLDTVELDGQGFETYVKAGDEVKQGQNLIELDLDYLVKHARSVVTPIVFTNLEENEKVVLKKTGKVHQGEGGVINIDS